MIGGSRLSLLHARRHPWRTVVLALCIGVSLFVPAAARVLTARYEAGLRARSRATPLIVGVPRMRFELTMAALYFRRSGVSPMTWGAYEEVREAHLGVAVPVNASATARGRAVVCTSVEYFEARGLTLEEGRLPARTGECVLGAESARALGLAPGAELYSDQTDSFDISRPAPIAMEVVGVLARAGSADDGVVFADISTAWVLAGLAHAHAPAETIPERLVLDRPQGGVRVSEQLIEEHRLTQSTLASVHLHADQAGLPLTCVLVFPPDARSATILKARVNAKGGTEAIVPEEVVEEFLEVVLRVRGLVEALGVLLVGCTLAVAGLVFGLSAKSRAREYATLGRIGASRATVAVMKAGEVLIVLVLALLTAGAMLAASAALAPPIERLIG